MSPSRPAVLAQWPPFLRCVRSRYRTAPVVKRAAADMQTSASASATARPKFRLGARRLVRESRGCSDHAGRTGAASGLEFHEEVRPELHSTTRSCKGGSDAPGTR